MNDLYSSKLFSLQAIEVEFENGAVRTFERLVEHRRHYVLMVAVTGAHEVLLVWEFSPGLGRHVLRLPSGRVDDGETPTDAARRELCEELGLDSGSQRIVHRFHNAPGHSDGFTDVVLLTDLRPSRLAGDEPEQLEQIAWPLGDLESLLEESAATDVRTIAALLLVDRTLGRDCPPSSSISSLWPTQRMAGPR